MVSCKTSTDVVVIGAGPVGLFTVFAAGMLDMRCHVIDILGKPGGQCSALYPDKPIYDVPAIPAITGINLVHNLLEQNSRFSPTMHMGQRVIDVSRREEDGVISVSTDAGLVVECKAVIIAAGNGAISPRKIDVENAEHFENKSLFYSVDDVGIFANSKVMVIGGGNSAVDWAIMLSDLASEMHLVHRRDKFNCFPDSENKVRDLAANGKVNLLTKYKVSGLVGCNGHLTSVELTGTEDGVTSIVQVDRLMVFLGLNSDTGSMSKWGITTGKFGRIPVDQRTMGTSVTGVFAVGDIADYEGKLRLISTGFGEASMACQAAKTLVHKDAPVHFEYSTHKFGPA